MKILYAEDTIDLNRAVTALLKHENYSVDSVFDGEEAMSKIADNAYDCIILDIMMPKKDGLSTLADIRKKKITTPVILLTAKVEVDDRVAGLDAGADDYLPKPFAMKELLARIRAATRRGDYDNKKLNYSDVELDPSTFALSNKSSVRLSVKEFELMQTLMSFGETEISTAALIEKVWRSDPEVDENTVWLYVSYLRGKLNSIGSNVKIVGEKGGSFKLKEN